jgi:uroporphyrinogen-III synthase
MVYTTPMGTDVTHAIRVVSLESRQASAMVSLLKRHGCEPISAPSMREIPLEDQKEAFAFGEKLLAGEVDVMVLLTGVGTRLLVEALSTRWPQADVVAALGRTTLCCRGPKPVAALKLLGLRPTLVAPEPNTWQELLDAISADLSHLKWSGLRLWVQEYGRPTPQLIEALEARGANVGTVSIYAWAMPLDTAPLAAGIRTLAERNADAVLFTSGKQVDHLMQLARELGCADALLSALREHVLCVSIGPVTTEALREHGFPIDLEPPHPKMGQMVMSVAQDARRLLAAKRGTTATT